MSQPPVRIAGLVSARALPKLVEEAIANAGHPVAGVGVIVKWDLIGRVLKDRVEAEKFANSVTEQINKAGIRATPAVLSFDKKIYAGFFEKLAIPQIREF